jgi:integrase
VGRRVRWPRYVQAFSDRFGARFYLRRPGFKRVKLPGLPWSPEFMAAYEAAMGGESAPLQIGASRTRPGTLNDAVVRYYQSAAFAALAEATRKHRRQVLDQFRSAHGDGNNVARGDRTLATLTRQQLANIVSKYSPHAQRHVLNALRAVMAHAVQIGMIENDPTLGIKRARTTKTGGYYTWTEDDIAQFERRHPIGSKARLALALMLYLALRRSDVVRVGPQHIRAAIFSIKPQKTARTTGVVVEIPVHPELAAIIAATPSGHLTFLATEQGRTRSANGFGNRMREWCNEAGLPECTSHGLRKAVCRRLAEAGASVNQIAAITGHKDLREIALYCEAADKRRMARQAMTLLQTESPETETGTSIVKLAGQFDNQGK